MVKICNCYRCGGELSMYDRDRHFDGCEDRYYICHNCDENEGEQVELIVKIRYFKIVKATLYHNGVRVIRKED